MPFKSEQQRRFLWAKHPDIAKRWTNEYGSKPMAGSPFAVNKFADKESKAEDKPGDETEPMHKSKRHKKLTKKQAQQVAKRRMALKQKQAQRKGHK